MINTVKLKLITAILGTIIVFFANWAFAANLTESVLTPMSATPGVSTNHTITFRTTSAIPAGGIIKITYPAGFDTSGVELGAYPSLFGTPTISSLLDTVVITMGPDSNVRALDLLSFQLLHVTNPVNSGNYSVSIETRNVNGQTIDGPTSTANFTIGQVQTLDHFNVVPSVNNPSVGSDLMLTITAQDTANATVTAYNGSPVLSGLAASPNNTQPYYGPVNFVNGVANVIVRSYSTQANQSVIVTDSGRTGNSGVINFVAGSLGAINITPNTTQTITAGQTVQFASIAIDTYGNVRSGDILTWTNANNTGLLTNTIAGTYPVSAKSGSINSNIVNVLVNPAALHHIQVSPSTNQSVKAGQTIQFTATCFDQFNNVRTGDVISWTNTNNSGLFTNNLNGIYNVKALSGGISSSEISVTVTHSEIVDHLTISPVNTHLVNADSSQTFTILAYDQYGNSWDVSNQTNFTSTDPKGSFVNNIYNAGKVGSWQITATFGDKSISTNITIDSAGTAAKAEPTNTVTQIDLNSVYQFIVKVYDADSNELSNPNIAWSIVEGNDNAVIDNQGRFIANKIGSYKVKATSGNASTIIVFEVKEAKNSSNSSSNQSSDSNKSTGSSNNTSSNSNTTSNTNSTNSTTSSSVQLVSPTNQSSTKTSSNQQSNKQDSAVVSSDNANQGVAVIVDDSNGQIKSAEVVTEGADSSKDKKQVNWVTIASIIIGLLILILAYWAYSIWVTPIETIDKKEANKNIPIPPAPIDKVNTSEDDKIDLTKDDLTRW